MNPFYIDPSDTRLSSGLILAFCLVFLYGCSTNSSGFEDVAPADELYAEGVDLLKGRNVLGVYTWINYTRAREPFQAIIDNYPYSKYETEAQIKIADTYFEEGNYEEALSYYRGFADLHPQHPKVPYTILRSALCYYNQIKSIDRDQTSTREALKYLEILSTKYPYAPATQEGEVILHQLRIQLADYMMEIGDFYLDRTQYQSAATRFRRVLDDYPGLGSDAEALYKLGLCYEEMKRIDEALRLYHVVLENFSSSPDAERAAERIAGAE
ncbi:MAG: outer membrane protein assembly factor BamD [Myxococcota bacterium]|jgi:outer membrane protein assembly factor BamD|nr:outer membrane protein assembly factor BamD [Myxococcota bacterium]